MKQEMVTATKKKDGIEYAATVSFDVPETCDEAKEQWGDNITVSNAIANARISLQSAIRRRLEKTIAEAEKEGKEVKIDESAIQGELAGYKPGEAAARKDPMEALLGRFNALPDEKKAEVLEQLKQRAKSK